ncbi:WD40 repeat domain-containing protein, partial [Aspergillus aculeatinus CBS 121060]
TKNPSVDAYIRDAKRFTLSSRSTIEPYPLQIYLSGLVFAPAQSTVRLLFEKEALHWTHRMPSISSNWSPLLQSLSGRVWSSRALAFPPCGKVLASAVIRGASKIVEVWDPVTGELLQAFDLPDLAVIPAENGMFGAVALSEVGELLALMVDSRTIQVWDVLSGCCIRRLTGHASEIIHAVASKDGSVLASTTVVGAIYVWDTYKAQCLQVIQSRHQSALFKPALSSDGNILAVISDDGILQLWQPTTGDLLRILKVQSAPKYGLSSDGQALDISKDGRFLTSVSYGQIQLWDIETGRCCQTTNMGVAECAGVALSPDGSMLATCARVSVRLWDLKAGEVMDPPTVIRTRNLRDVRFSPHGRLLAVLSVDLQLYVWDTLTGRCLGDLGHTRDAMREFELWEV